ncbi:3-hydroxyacyl-[acyl-carrier-protein] dehydratase [Bathymodiolus japonicus methanotrophic gill symbiont]|uniref:hydroxymyristoyl-ACP dehydratase n=1 Tax=Bathymodiolus japonicus methanotrophic gill symbiont TaxID=113269 RepID=UPI001B6DA0E3|nr:hydroxymyristoyl-ACP dehydratase [Bathymodiolus japonicus methanotrophic gill symbiont]GFO73221.1 3-hydroxyacyl-[acyl-carrier-protein] dehydratase [Bathymodiolus japonicus methanotrophic gill symbiont]
MLENKQHYCIPATHPCFAGHFPSNPIVPGVVILNFVEHQLLRWLPDYQIISLAQAKFLHPLHPEEDFTISLTLASARNIKFICTRHTDILATGSLLIQEIGPNHD